MKKITKKSKKNGSRLQNDEDTKAKINDLLDKYFGAQVLESDGSFWKAMRESDTKNVISELARCYLTPPPKSVDFKRLFGPAANIATDEQTFCLVFFL